MFDKKGLNVERNGRHKWVKISIASRDRLISVDIQLFFDDNKIKMARKRGKKQNENPIECTGEGKR